MLIQVHGQILIDSFNWMFLLERTLTVNFPCGIQKRQQNKQNNERELKHAVVHHVERNEYTMEYVQERMVN